MSIFEQRLASLVKQGIWPESKEASNFSNEGELVGLGYIPFFTGKNGDIYLSPYSENEALIVRSDRCSVFDIPLSDTIYGKGAIQNEISLLGAKFAQRHGVKTAILPMPENIPVYIALRSQYVELCKP